MYLKVVGTQELTIFPQLGDLREYFAVPDDFFLAFHSLTYFDDHSVLFQLLWFPTFHLIWGGDRLRAGWYWAGIGSLGGSHIAACGNMPFGFQ